MYDTKYCLLFNSWEIEEGGGGGGGEIVSQVFPKRIYLCTKARIRLASKIRSTILAERAKIPDSLLFTDVYTMCARSARVRPRRNLFLRDKLFGSRAILAAGLISAPSMQAHASRHSSSAILTE